VSEFGSADLQPGEFEVVVNPREQVRRGDRPARSQPSSSVMQDLDGNGIPDNAEMQITRTKTDAAGEQTTQTAKFRQQQNPSVIDEPSSRDRLEKFAALHSRNTEGGQTARERILNEKERQAGRQHQIAQTRAQFVEPQQVESGEAGRQFDATHDEGVRRSNRDFTESGRQFDKKNTPKVTKDEATGESVLTFNGQAFKLGRPDENGEREIKFGDEIVGVYDRQGKPHFDPRRGVRPPEEDEAGEAGDINFTNFGNKVKEKK